MPHGKYLYWFRFQFPIDWANKKAHEINEAFFIIADSNEKALEWGNRIVEKYLEELSRRNNYDGEIKFIGLIMAEPGFQFTDSEKEEIEKFPVLNFGEYFDGNFEIIE